MKNRPWLRWGLVGVGVVTLAALAWVAAGTYSLARVTTGAVAKAVCSGIFVSGRTRDQILKEDMRLPAWMSDYFAGSGLNVDETDKRVVADVYGFARREAFYRGEMGCSAPGAMSRDEIAAQPVPRHAPALVDDFVVNVIPALSPALDAAFAERAKDKVIGTRAIVVVHRGAIVAERYATGVAQHTKLLGYSMSKSVIATLVGLRIAEGELAFDQARLLPQWEGKGDPRAKITIEHLLQMRAGLAFDETYDDPFSDAITAVSQVDDSGAFAAEKPLVEKPGTVWRYSTGTNLILSKVVRRSFDGDLGAHFQYPWRALFDPVGMGETVLEPDASGNFMFAWATARDWARFGLLYLNDGVVSGRRILPASWVSFVRTPAPGAIQEKPYGGQFWLNALRPDAKPRWPDIPADAYAALGHQGQYVLIVPSANVVIVRLGSSSAFDAWDVNAFVREVLVVLAQHDRVSAASDTP